MDEGYVREEFGRGLALLRAGEARDALPHLRRCVAHDPQFPLYISYLGLAIGLAEDDWVEAEDLCYQALRMGRQQSNLYLNLAEVYRRTGQKDEAVWLLRAGLDMTKQDPSISEALSQFGVRQRRALTFLDRKHFLNRNLGKLRHSFSSFRDLIP
jgi:predicted Zn-dependent protease